MLLPPRWQDLDSDLAGQTDASVGLRAARRILDGAITAYRKATTLAPWNRSYFYLLGRALGSRGDLDGAIANFRKIVAEGPGGFSAKYELSQALWDRGDFAEAIATYEEIVKVNPKHDTAFDNLAWWLATCPEVKFRNPARAVELAGKLRSILTFSARGSRWEWPSTARTITKAPLPP